MWFFIKKLLSRSGSFVVTIFIKVRLLLQAVFAGYEKLLNKIESETNTGRRVKGGGFDNSLKFKNSLV